MKPINSERLILKNRQRLLRTAQFPRVRISRGLIILSSRSLFIISDMHSLSIKGTISNLIDKRIIEVPHPVANYTHGRDSERSDNAISPLAEAATPISCLTVISDNSVASLVLETP